MTSWERITKCGIFNLFRSILLPCLMKSSQITLKGVRISCLKATIFCQAYEALNCATEWALLHIYNVYILYMYIYIIYMTTKELVYPSKGTFYFQHLPLLWYKLRH